MIGAQIHIEPEMMSGKIEDLMHMLKLCGMDACRISMPEKYCQSGDFTIIEKTLEVARKHDVSVIMLLDGSDEFKENVVTRFKGNKTIIAWETDNSPVFLKTLKSLDNKRKIITTSSDVFRNGIADTDEEIGLSLLPGFHFGYFSRKRFHAAISAACDMARCQGKPFWVTELQAGSNIYSGDHCFSPTPAELTQWIWTAIGCGAQGIILKSLNSGSKNKEAGEMSLLNMQGDKTGRSEAVRAINEALNEHADLFKDAKPIDYNFHILYCNESLKVEEGVEKDDQYEGKYKGGAMKSAMAFYTLLMERGMRPVLCEMGDFDWGKESYKGRTVIIAGQMVVPTKYYPMIREFVKKGGQLFIEGTSFSYNEEMDSVFSMEFPLADVFGGYVEEFNCAPGERKIRFGKKKMWIHLFDGILRNEASGESLNMLRCKYGRGNVTWIPSGLGLGAIRTGHRRKPARFLRKEFAASVDASLFHFRVRRPNIVVQMMQTGDKYISIVCNTGRHRRRVKFNGGMTVDKLLFTNPLDGRLGKARNHKVKLRAGQTVVALWHKDEPKK